MKKQLFGYFGLQALVVLTVAFFGLNLSSFDLSVPLSYRGDAVFMLIYVKAVIEQGWANDIARLSFPFGYSGAAFPMLTSVDWALMKVIAIFTNEPGRVVNIFWLITLVLSAWSSSYASYQLGISRLLSFACGLLYAFLPFAFSRNVDHLNLVYYLVPLLCLLVIIIISRGRYARNLREATLMGLLACIFQGLNYVYYSYFAVLLILFSTVVSYSGAGKLKQFLLPIVAISLIFLATTFNLYPYFASIGKNGNPPELGYKSLSEAEVYGAKLRRMISPHENNEIPIISAYSKKESDINFPLENENKTVRLGLFGAFGFLFLIFVALRALSGYRIDGRISVLAALSVLVFLFITVGGIGVVVNILTVPDIRAYNRFSVFLSFFSISALALFFQDKLNQLTGLRRNFLIGGLVGLLSVSFYDQTLGFGPLRFFQSMDSTAVDQDKEIVKIVENNFPSGTHVLQLPFTGFPLNLQSNKMWFYDHARPFIWSSELYWSWPSFSLRHRAWQTKLSKLQGENFIRGAILSGFQAIWIDRFAYPDNGAQIVNELSIEGTRAILLPSDRIVVLDLSEAAMRYRASMPPGELDKLAKTMLGPEVVLDWGKGFYEEEINPEGIPFRWAHQKSKLTVRNLGSEASTVCLNFTLVSPNPGNTKLTAPGVRHSISTSAEGARYSIPLNIAASSSAVVDFRGDMNKLDSGLDSRELFFFIKYFSLETSSGPEQCIGNRG